VTDLQTTLASDFGISGFTAARRSPPSGSAPTSSSTFSSTRPGRSRRRPGGYKLTFRGDAEAGVALTLVDHWEQGDHRGGFRTAVEGLVRFPTGRVAQPDRLIPLGTGDGQTDIEVRLTDRPRRRALGIPGGRRLQPAARCGLPGSRGPPTQPFAGIDLLKRRPPGSGRHS